MELGVGLLFLKLTTAAAAPIVVPRDAATIQEGLDRSVAGDTVLVLPGTYGEQIVFPAHDVSLIAFRGPEQTQIDGQNAGTAVTIDQGDHRGSLLGEFTVTGGNASDGGGILISGASPTIRGNTIVGNYSSDDGGGILVVEGGVPWIAGNLIEAIECGRYGGGIRLDRTGPQSLVEENEIIENRSHWGGGGIQVNVCDQALLRHNHMRGNWAGGNRGGVSISSCDDARIEGGSISWNRADGRGGGVKIYYGEVELHDIDIVGNYANFDGGGVHVSHDYGYEEIAVIVGCIVAGNSASSRGGGIYREYGGGALERCTVAANSLREPDGEGAGIYWSRPESSASILGGIIANNEPDGIYGYRYSGQADIDLTRNLMWGHSGNHYGNLRPGAWDVIADPLPLAPDSLDWRLRADSRAIDAGLKQWQVPEGGGKLADIGADEVPIPDGEAVGVVLDSVPSPVPDDTALRIAARVVNRTSRPLEARLQLALTGVGGAAVALDSLIRVPRFGGSTAAGWVEIEPAMRAGPASVTARVLVDRPSPGPALLAADARALSIAHVGDTLRVPGDAATIGEGIALSQDGDLLLVAAGTWLERIDFDGKAIHILGADGPQACVIDAQGDGTAVVFQRSEDSLSVLQGFTVTGGFSDLRDDLGGGMRIAKGCSPTLREIWFVANEAARSGGGVRVGGGSPLFACCVFDGNIAGGLGGGLAVVDSTAHPRVRSCTFYANVAGEGGALSLAIGDLTLEGTLLLANSAYGATADSPNQILQGGGNVYWANEPAQRGPVLIPANRLPGDRDIDPLLRDPAIGDFTPLPGSPLVNAGPAMLDPGPAGGPRADVGAVELPYPLVAPIEVSLVGELPPLTGGEPFDWSYRLISRADTSAGYDVVPSIIGDGSALVELDTDRATLDPGDTLDVARSDLLPDLLPSGDALLRLQVLDRAGDPAAAAVAEADLHHIPRTLRVPEDHPTIGAAIEKSLHADTVEIGPGTWNELLRPADRRIVL